MPDGRNLTIYTAQSRRDQTLQPVTMTVSEFFNRLRQTVPLDQSWGAYQALSKVQRDALKDRGGFVAGVLDGGHRRSGCVASRCCAVLDMDSCPSGTTEDVARRVAGLGVAYSIYSTASHHPSKPRLRVVIPFAEDVSADQYRPVVRLLAQKIQRELTWFDPTCDQAERLMYWPSNCADVGPVFYADSSLPLCDPAALLAALTDWRDATSWPSWPGSDAIPRLAAKQGDPTAKTGLVGAFCRVYDVETAMDVFLPGIYSQAGPGRYTFTGGSSYGGAVLYDNGKFLYSHHATDPCGSRLVNAFDLVRLHKFGALDADAAHGTPSNRLPSYREMLKLAQGDAAVRGELAREFFRAPQSSGEQREHVTQGIDLDSLRPESNARYPWNDVGNGNLFADIFHEVARYVPERKKWYIFNGCVWEPDAGNLQAAELCKQLANRLAIYALGLPEGDTRDRYRKFVESWQRRHVRETILKDAASVYPVSLSEFDKDPWMFNCQNGTLNLKTGEFHQHCAADMFTELAGVAYDPAARCDRWESFMDEVMCGDAEKVIFLQKAFGYSLTGDTSEECFFIPFGATTRNGKSTALEAIMRLMGSYARSAKPDTIAQKNQARGGAPSEDVARLAGARLVNIAEPEKNLVLSSALVKTLTGNDTINARFLNENSFEFKPCFKLFVNTNHLPQVTDTTLFSSGRVKVIPFERHFTAAEQDKQLKHRLCQPDSLSGILNWCLVGLRLWQEAGLEPPQAILDATEAYRLDSDKTARFISEEMEPGPGYEVKTADAYLRYQAWCVRFGFQYGSVKSFSADIQGAVQVKRKRPKSGGGMTTVIVGYQLKAVV